MEEGTYTLGLALLDFVPNLAFLAGATFLIKTLRLARGERCSRMCLSGSVLIFTGGMLKAIWKLLLTLGAGDFQLFSQVQFILLAPGFLALLISAILLARSTPLRMPSGVLAIAAWKIPLLAVMTLSSLGAQGILTYIAFRQGVRLAAWGFIIAVLCMLGMSGMASGSEQTIANQWIEESMNATGQIAFALGCWWLYRHYRRTTV